MNLIKDKVSACYFRYLIPSLLSSVVTSIYGFVDTIAIGRGVGYLGTAALSACATTASFGLFFALR